MLHSKTIQFLKNNNFYSVALYICLIFYMHSTIIHASQYWPNAIFSKPDSTEPYLATVGTIYSGAYASTAFNNEGQTVPFLQQYGNEDLLIRFVDHSLPYNDVTSMGQGQLSGTYGFQQFSLFLNKNIHHDLFLTAQTVFQNIEVNSIQLNYAPQNEPLTSNQIEYIETLSKIIPISISQWGMFTTAFFIGYNKKIDHFSSIDYLQFVVKTGMATPQWMYNNNNSMLQVPLSGNINFNYPIITMLTVGLFDKITFGFYGIGIGFQPRTQYIPINTTNSNNQLLLTEATNALISPKPLFAATIYSELHDKTSRWKGTIAYSYLYGFPIQVTPVYQVEIANSPIFNAFNFGSLIFQIDYNFATESYRNAPAINLFYSIPINGALFQKAYLLGGSCNFQISYQF